MRSVKARIAFCLGIGLCLAGMAGADTRWGGGSDTLWSNPLNWNNGVPNTDQKAQFVSGGAPECILDVPGAQAKQIAVGDGGGGHLKIVAGSLSVRDWSIVGYAEGNVGDEAGYLTVTGGELNCQARLFVGFMGEGHMTVDEDGVVNVYNQVLGLGEEKTGKGYLYLKGGVMNLWAGGSSLDLYNGEAHIDFSGGVLTLPNTSQNRATLTQALGDGIITAYDGAGQVIVDTESTPNRIVVKGVHPLSPTPEDGSEISAGNAELGWVLPDPCQPGQPVTVDVYFGTSPDFPIGGSPETPRIISGKSVTSTPVQIQPKTRYYWAVDVYYGPDQDPVYGPIFSFVADNLVPIVNAGDDVVTWLAGGIADVMLDATVTDDGFLKPYTVQWTLVSEPAAGTAVLRDPKAEDMVATLSAVGPYVFSLSANDGEYTGSDTVTVNVYGDSCEAAKSLPGYQPLPGDINGDCRVNDLDMAILQEHWLECNALDCNDLP